MKKEYAVTEIEFDKKQIETWSKEIEEFKQGKEHIHLEYNGGEILIHIKQSS